MHLAKIWPDGSFYSLWVLVIEDHSSEFARTSEFDNGSVYLYHS